MSRIPSLSSPFLLGFDEIERALDRVAKAADGYPPYNIERIARENGRPERLRITLAVAGFNRDELDVTVEENQLLIRGRRHRGAPIPAHLRARGRNGGLGGGPEERASVDRPRAPGARARGEDDRDRRSQRMNRTGLDTNQRSKGVEGHETDR